MQFQGRYHFLSNFTPVIIIDQHLIRYPSSEHAYQAAKSDDFRVRRKIAQLATPGQAKRFGKTVVLRPDWEVRKLHSMEVILRQKFRYTDYRQLLLATNDEPLVEENTWHDNYWGQCICGRCGPGLNHLGRILMNIRHKDSNVGKEHA